MLLEAAGLYGTFGGMERHPFSGESQFGVVPVSLGHIGPCEPVARDAAVVAIDVCLDVARRGGDPKGGTLVHENPRQLGQAHTDEVEVATQREALDEVISSDGIRLEFNRGRGGGV